MPYPVHTEEYGAQGISGVQGLSALAVDAVTMAHTRMGPAAIASAVTRHGRLQRSLQPLREFIVVYFIDQPLIMFDTARRIFNVALRSRSTQRGVINESLDVASAFLMSAHNPNLLGSRNLPWPRQ